ncbi:MAG: hypothetical protein WBR10_05330 [Candidatus Acidiferrum sp.]
MKVAAGWLTDRRALAQNRKGAAAFESKNLYLSLREQALQMKREKIGLPVPSKPEEPWAALMEWGLGSGTATVVAISDGTASVYLSGGGGSIGGGESHESIRKAARKMVSVAADFQLHMQTSDTHPLPRPGQIVFYALTDAGVFMVSASQDELSSRRTPLSKLGDAAQEILAQYRLVQKSK